MEGLALLIGIMFLSLSVALYIQYQSDGDTGDNCYATRRKKRKPPVNCLVSNLNRALKTVHIKVYYKRLLLFFDSL